MLAPMPRAALLGLALLGCGCRFDLDRWPRPAGSVDGARVELGAPDRGADKGGGGGEARLPELGPDAPRPDQSCAAVKKSLAVEADAAIVATGGGNLKYGDFSILHIGTGINSHGLVRFDLPVAPASLRALRLTLTPVASDEECGKPCKSCDPIQKAGKLDLHYMASSWTEATVTWFSSNYNVGPDWLVPGAEAASERSPAVAGAAFAPGHPVVFEILKPDSLALVATWRTGNKLSFQIVPQAGTALIAASREQPTQGCGPDTPPPSLEVEYCP